MGYRRFVTDKIRVALSDVESLPTDNAFVACTSAKLRQALAHAQAKEFRATRRCLSMAACSLSNFVSFGGEDVARREAAVYVHDFIVFETSRAAWVAGVCRASLPAAIRRARAP